MIPWRLLSSPKQLEEINTFSVKTPCIIFKYSPECSVCKFVKLRIEDDWDFSEREIIPYLIDIAKYKQLAQSVADQFQNPHESPQILLLRNGICTYDAAGFDITVEELHECYEDNF